TSILDEAVGKGLMDATAAAVWTVHALTPMIALVSGRPIPNSRASGGNHRYSALALDGHACNQKILLSALMNPADAWSKSRTSSAVPCVAIRNKHRGIPAHAGIPNVSALRKRPTATGWKSQRKCLAKRTSPHGDLPE